MEEKYPKKERGQPQPSRPRKPSPKEREESANTLYHIAIAIIIGISLCLFMGALDYVSQDTTPTASKRATIEYLD